MFKKVLFVVLAVVLFGGSALAFAWWDNLEVAENDVTIGIGQGVTISVNLDEQTTGVLVPSGVVLKTGDVTEVDVEFTVSLDSTDLLNALDLEVLVTNIQIGGSTANAGLVNVVVTNPGTIQNSPAEVTITVTLDMPGSQAVYDAIINEDITFDVTFTASQPE